MTPCARERAAAIATLIRGAEGRTRGEARGLRRRDDGGSASTTPRSPQARAALGGGPAGRIAIGDSRDLRGRPAPVAPPDRRRRRAHRDPSRDARERRWDSGRSSSTPASRSATRNGSPTPTRSCRSGPTAALEALAPNASTAIAVLTHDPKLDDPALVAALRSPAFYVGALGSRRTQEKRRARLLEAGMTEAELSRLHAPIGLDLGGRSPEEIALAVVAQIVAARNGR